MLGFKEYIKEERLDEFVWTPASTSGLARVAHMIGMEPGIAGIILIGAIILGILSPFLYSDLVDKLVLFKADLRDKKLGKSVDPQKLAKEVEAKIKQLPAGKRKFAQSLLNKAKKSSSVKDIGKHTRELNQYLDKEPQSANI